MQRMESNLAYLTSDIGRLFRKRLDCLARPAGLTGMQMRVLMYTQRFPGANQVTLANFLEVEPITAGRMVDRMVTAELIERRPDPNDRRAWLLHPTAKGSEAANRLKGDFSQSVDSALEGLDNSARRTLESLLTQVRQNLVDQIDEEEAAHG